MSALPVECQPLLAVLVHYDQHEDPQPGSVHLPQAVAGKSSQENATPAQAARDHLLPDEWLPRPRPARQTYGWYQALATRIPLDSSAIQPSEGGEHTPIDSRVAVVVLVHPRSPEALLDLGDSVRRREQLELVDLPQQPLRYVITRHHDVWRRWTM